MLLTWSEWIWDRIIADVITLEEATGLLRLELLYRRVGMWPRLFVTASGDSTNP